MLQRHIEIPQNLGLPPHDGEQLVGNMFRITVEQPDPTQAIHGAQPLQQLGKQGTAGEILSIHGRVLRHQNQLPDTLCGQPLRLPDKGVHLTAAQIAPDQRNRTIGAAVVAAVRDPHIGKKGGGW